MPFDRDAAVKHLRASKLAGSTGKCATFVRKALAAGGIDMSGSPLSAKDYGPFLLSKSFTVMAADNPEANPDKADVVVIQNYVGGSVHGHIAMYDGSVWISDFAQRDMWGGPGYRKARPAHAIYRYTETVAAWHKPVRETASAA